MEDSRKLKASPSLTWEGAAQELPVLWILNTWFCFSLQMGDQRRFRKWKSWLQRRNEIVLNNKELFLHLALIPLFV